MAWYGAHDAHYNDISLESSKRFSLCLGPLTVQTLPPLAGPVSVSRVLARGTSLARLRQGPFLVFGPFHRRA
ncbi:unnamed protein product [Lasius platythorax]|uniref:Uncharacterized protein n=1 Tax=Lasius platythorax TaxID=488582 RepID=A0AAV2P1W2_9HYME